MILAKRPRSDAWLSSGLNAKHGGMHATTLIARPMASQSSVLLPKPPLEQSYTSHLETLSVGRMIFFSTRCLELGPSGRVFKVQTAGAPSGVVLGNYIGTGHGRLNVHTNCRCRNRYDSTQSCMICIILCINNCKYIYLCTFLNSNIFVHSQSRRNVKLHYLCANVCWFPLQWYWSHMIWWAFSENLCKSRSYFTGSFL